MGEASNPGPVYSLAQLEGRALEHAFCDIKTKEDPFKREIIRMKSPSGQFVSVRSVESPDVLKAVRAAATAAVQIVDSLKSMGINLVGADAGVSSRVEKKSSCGTDIPPGKTILSVDVRLERSVGSGGPFYSLCEAKWSPVPEELSSRLEDAMFVRDRALLGVASEDPQTHYFSFKGKGSKVFALEVGALAVTPKAWRLEIVRVSDQCPVVATGGVLTEPTGPVAFVQIPPVVAVVPVPKAKAKAKARAVGPTDERKQHLAFLRNRNKRLAKFVLYAQKNHGGVVSVSRFDAWCGANQFQNWHKAQTGEEFSEDDFLKWAQPRIVEQHISLL